MRVSHLCFWLMMSLLPHRSMGQPAERFVVETIGLRQGLPTADIHALFRDAGGYLWLGTDIGLVRYDGFGFETISVSQEGRWLGLVNAITEDSNGRLWVGTEDGLFMVQQGVAHAVKSVQADPFHRMKSLLLDKQQNLWCATSSGVYRLDVADLQKIAQSPTALIRPEPLPGYQQLVPQVKYQQVLSLAFDEKGRIYFGAYSGLFRYESGNQETRNDKPASQPSLLRLWPAQPRKVEIQALAVRDANDIVFTTFDPLCYIRLHNGTEERLFANLYSTDVVCQANQFWYLSFGLYRQGPADTRPVFLADLCKNNRGSFTKLYIDNEGIFWVATNEGLLKIRPAQFESVPLPPAVSGGEINGLGVYDNQLLVGAHRGRVFAWANDTLQKKLGDLTSVAGVNAIHQDQRRTLWLTTTYQGLFSFDGRKTRRYTAADGLGNEGFNDIVPTRSGDLWAVGDVGITRIRYDSTAVSSYRLQFYEHKLNRYKFTIFYSGLETPDGTLWLASDYGLVSFSKGQFRNHRLTIGGVTVRSVRKITPDKQGAVWLATEGQGLLYGQFRNGAFQLIRQYTTRDGLPSNTFSDVFVDSNGRIWAGGSMALSCILSNRATAQMRNFDYRDGFFEESFQNPRMFEYPAGTLWIGSSEGLMRFPLQQLIQTQPTLPVRITQVQLREQNDDPLRYAAGKDARTGLPVQCQLPASHNALTISFNLPSLINPAFNRYRFRLEGSGEDWRSTSGSDRSVTYSGLKPGQYTFRLIGATANGIWTAPASFSFEILPPIWQQGWFIGLFLALTGFGIWGSVRYRERRIRQREAEKNRLAQLVAELETKAIRAQMNPHFIFNCLNSIQECILADNTHAAYRYLSKFSRLLRMILDESARNFHSIQQELDLIRLYLELESLRFDQPMHHTIEVAPDIDTLNWQVPSLLLQPLVENAIWHGLIHQSGDRQIRLSIRQDTAATLLCTIEDNGVGRARASDLASRKLVPRTTKGMALVTERLSLLEPAGHGQGTLVIDDLTDAQGRPLGTRIRVYLPIITSISVRTNPLSPSAHVSRLSH